MGRPLSARQESLVVVGGLPYNTTGPSFLLPVLQKTGEPEKSYIQVPNELTGTILDFVKLDDDLACARLATNPLPVSIGENLIYGFSATGFDCQLGTLAELEAPLRMFLQQNPEQVAIALQIVELIGDAQEKKIARLSMRTEIHNLNGLKSARAFYEGSTLRTALWNQLIKQASSPEIARSVLHARSRVNAYIDSNGAILFEFGALSADVRASFDENLVRAELLREFQVSSIWDGDTQISKNPSVHVVVEVQREVDSTLKLIRGRGRQEERIAVLLDSILKNPTVGLSTLLQYQTDRGAFARWALDELNKLFIRQESKSNGYEVAIAQLIPKMFSKHYPLSRGELLLFLAQHLSARRLIRSAIQDVLDRTNSVFVGLFRPQIAKIFEEADKQTASNE